MWVENKDTFIEETMEEEECEFSPENYVTYKEVDEMHWMVQETK